MHIKYLQTIYANEEDRKSARILFALIVASCATYLVVSVTGLYWSDWKLISATAAGSVLQILPLGLLRRGHLRASSLIFVFSVLGTITLIATYGQGIHDLAIMAFPIIILFAGLSLQRNYFKFSVWMTLAAMGWLVFGEAQGLFISQPYETPQAMDFIVVAIILLVGAFGVNLLATNLRQSLERAQREIAQRQLAEEKIKQSEKRFYELIKHGRDNISLLATDGTLQWDSPSAANLLGYGSNHLVGKNIFEFIHPDDQTSTRDIYAQVILSPGTVRTSELRVLHADGTWRWIECSATNLLDEPSVQAIVLNYRDITERKQAQDLLRFQSTHDVLTGIYNRAFFEAELARLEHSRDFPISVIVADVDKLKTANDTQGHAKGDELLRHTAQVLATVFRESDVLARIGGDEFAVLLPATDATTVEQMVSRVRARLQEHNAQYPDLPLWLSLGVASAEKNNLTGTFTLADQRMYADKAARKSGANDAPGTNTVP